MRKGGQNVLMNRTSREKGMETIPMRRKGERREEKYHCGGHIKREIE